MYSEMHQIDYLVPQHLEPYINCVMILDNADPNAFTKIPIYADGYPGIMFQQSENGFYLQPRNKKLSEFFLYGQTLEPITLESKGTFSFIVFQLYPFASKYLLNVDPKVLNDDCYDLLQHKQFDMDHYQQILNQAGSQEEQISIITEFMLKLIKATQVLPDDRIQQAIDIILHHRGQIAIREVLDQLYVTERTFERNFVAEVGLTPKQFARIVQFQSSLHQLSQDKFDRLTQVGFDSGFADQSHFIRAFKKYTGQTPSYYLKQMSA